jgi:sulfur carrier protein
LNLNRVIPAKEKVNGLAPLFNSMPMELTINNERVERNSDFDLNTLLEELNISSMKGVAVAVNNQVVPKHEVSQFKLKEQDSILVIRATQGG